VVDTVSNKAVMEVDTANNNKVINHTDNNNNLTEAVMELPHQLTVVAPLPMEEVNIFT
jgi:hypothetical protein